MSSFYASLKTKGNIKWYISAKLNYPLCVYVIAFHTFPERKKRIWYWQLSCKSIFKKEKYIVNQPHSISLLPFASSFLRIWKEGENIKNMRPVTFHLEHWRYWICEMWNGPYLNLIGIFGYVMPPTPHLGCIT